MVDEDEFRNFMLSRNKPLTLKVGYQIAEETDNIAIYLVNYLDKHSHILNGKYHKRTEQLLEELCLA